MEVKFLGVLLIVMLLVSGCVSESSSKVQESNVIEKSNTNEKTELKENQCPKNEEYWCSGIDEEEFYSLKEEKRILEQEVDELRKNYNTCISERDNLKEEINKVNENPSNEEVKYKNKQLSPEISLSNLEYDKALKILTFDFYYDKNTFDMRQDRINVDLYFNQNTEPPYVYGNTQIRISCELTGSKASCGLDLGSGLSYVKALQLRDVYIELCDKESGICNWYEIEVGPYEIILK